MLVVPSLARRGGCATFTDGLMELPLHLRTCQRVSLGHVTQQAKVDRAGNEALMASRAAPTSGGALRLFHSPPSLCLHLELLLPPLAFVPPRPRPPELWLVGGGRPRPRPTQLNPELKKTSQQNSLEDVAPYRVVDLSSVHDIAQRSQQQPRPSIFSPWARFLSDKGFYLRSAQGHRKVAANS